MEPNLFLKHFLESSTAHEDAVAIIGNTGEWTYKELLLWSQKVNAYVQKTCKEQHWIGINVNDDLHSYAQIIGVWMAGKAYVPIDENAPLARQKALFNRLGEIPLLSSKTYEDQEPMASVVTEGEYLYLISSSGSTGNPKNIPISKLNLNAFLQHYLQNEAYKFSNEDRFLQSYELGFDVSVFCFTLPLMLGASLYLLPSKGIKFLNVAKAIQDFKITVCSNVPSIAKYLSPRIYEVDFSSLRYCFFSGDALLSSWAKRWMAAASGAKVYNCYGPSETTIVCTTVLLNDLSRSYFEEDQVLPLGEPFENHELKIVGGELLVKGPQVFSGYLNKVSRYTNNWYPTGDMAHYDEQGQLIFDGRKDFQVQIDGYRVELEEVNNALRKVCPTDWYSFVLNTDSKPLLLSCSDKDFSEVDFSTLTELLPAYAIPKRKLLVHEFPLNSNGKVDREKLMELVQKLLANV